MPEKSTGLARLAPSRNPLTVKSLHKAIKVLEAFRDRRRSLSLEELASMTGLEKSAVQRATYTLKQAGYLTQDTLTRRYQLGLRALDLAFNFLRAHPLVERASPILMALRQATQERVDFTLPDEGSVVYVIRMQTKHETLLHASIGRRVPMYCSAGGRAILASLSEAEATRIIEGSRLQAFTPHTVTERAALMAAIHKANRLGYAFQREEWRVGEIVVAAAVTDEAGRPVAAVHIAGSTNDWNAIEFERRMAPLVLAAAHDIGG